MKKLKGLVKKSKNKDKGNDLNKQMNDSHNFRYQSMGEFPMYNNLGGLSGQNEMPGSLGNRQNQGGLYGNANFTGFQDDYFGSRMDRQNDGFSNYQKRTGGTVVQQFTQSRAKPQDNLYRAQSAASMDEDRPQVEEMEGDTYNYAGRMSKQSYLDTQGAGLKFNNQMNLPGQSGYDNTSSAIRFDDSKGGNGIDAFLADVVQMREDNDTNAAGGSDGARKMGGLVENYIGNDRAVDTSHVSGASRTQDSDAYAKKDARNDLVFELDKEEFKDKDVQETAELDKESIIGGTGLKFSLADKMRRKKSTNDAVVQKQMASKPVPVQDVIKEEDDELAEEEADKVPDMPGNSFFDRKKQDGNKSATVGSSSEFFKGRQRSGQSGPIAMKKQNSDQPKKNESGSKDFAPFSRVRGMSFVQMKRNRQKKAQSSEQAENGNNTNKNRDPRLSIYNEKALSLVDSFLVTSQYDDGNKPDSRLQAEKDLQAEVKRYRAILQSDKDKVDAEDSQAEQDKNKINQLINGEDGKPSEIQQKQLLEDFYKQMNIDAEAEFNKHLERKQGLDPQERQPTRESKVTNNELINGHNRIIEMDQANKRRHDTFYEHFKEDFTQESIDMIRFIDWNERRHIVDAQQYLSQNSQITRKSMINDTITQHRLSQEYFLKDISHKLAIDRQVNGCKPTSIALTDELILIGNTNGELCMFDRETQEPYVVFQEKGKEFQGNAVSAIDVHPTRPEYVLIGYQFGQLVLVDLTSPEKSLKVIKDHHKGASIANVAFCDWVKQPQGPEKQRAQYYAPHGQLSGAFLSVQSTGTTYDDSGLPDQSPYVQTQKPKEVDLQAWMFASVDSFGRVVVTTITKQMFMFKSTKQVLIEPQLNESRYFSLSARFKSDLHPSQNFNDAATLLAVGNDDRVIIFALNPKECQVMKEIIKPVYFNIQVGQYRELKNCQPSICWGYGHSPVFKDQCYSTMVIGWGPLIQIYVLNDIMDANACFFGDGHHVIIPEADKAQNNANKNQPFSQGDMSPFELQKLFIEKICFLSESVLLVLTRSFEFKLFYTQNFDHGFYTEEKSTKQALYEEPHAKRQALCQIDSGMYANSVAESRYGQLYNQTICIFNGMVAGMSVHGVFQYLHLRWDDSLQEYKKIVRGNWIQLFQRAIDIYIGRVKGFKDVPEEQYMRQETMKAELKLLIRNIITQQMDMWAAERAQVQRQVMAQQQAQQVAAKSDNPYDDNPYSQAAVKQQPVQQQKAFHDVDDMDVLNDLNNLSKQEKSKQLAERYRTLLRIAIEFCVTIQDCYFLFYDLFLMFQEESLENIFLDELKPFIMAGRFQEWDLPGDILQNHIINYYKASDRPELVEKIIINLSFKDCPKSLLLELVQFCEEKCLCTGLLYLQTAVSYSNEESLCVPVILTLLQLYRDAKRNNPGSLDEIRCIKDLSPDSQERLKAEKSQIYLGYKILWAIRLFLNGKKFPAGNIPEKLWRSYVLELVDCISQSQVMLDLLYIDSEAYFQIVSIVFYKGKVFDFIEQGNRQRMHALRSKQGRAANQIISDEIFDELMGAQLSQKQILERFDIVCQNKEQEGYVVPDEIRLQYLFFVANVPSSNNAAIQKEPQFYYQCIMQLLRQSQKFLRFNKNLMKRALTRKGRMMQMDRQLSVKLLDEQKYIIAGENALISLLKLCEPLSTEQINQLLIMTEYSKFSHLRVKLLEMKGDYVACLQLFVEGMRVRDYISNPDSAAKVFEFIRERLTSFQKANQVHMDQADLSTSASTVNSKPDQQNPQTQQEEQFRTQIINCFSSLVKIDQKRSFELVDQFFGHDQERIFDSLNGHAEEQFQFLDTMFIQQHDKIQSLIEKHLMSALENKTDSDRAEQYMKLQKLHFRLLCQVRPSGVIDRVRQIKRNEIKLAPVDCLDICEQYQQVEACAMLSHKISSYLASVTYYMQLVTEQEHFNFPLLIKQLAVLVKSGRPIPVFIPYLAKQDTKKHKLIMKAASIGKDERGRMMQGSEEVKDEDLQVSQLIRFDHVIRKAMKICVKESKENQNFDNVDKTWFFVLECMFKIRQGQNRILTRIREQNVTMMTKQVKIEQAQTELQYQNHLKNFEEFFQSRLNFVIEQSLNHIELKAFLDRVVGHDQDLKFAELSEMIQNIFTEVRSEALVLVNAYQTAQQQITSTFENCGQSKQNGILFRYRQCNLCKRFVDEEIQDKKKKLELLMYARKGSFISPSIIGAYKFDQDSDEEWETADQSGFYAGEKMSIFPCGHAFHIQCLRKHAKERAEQKLQQQNAGPPGRNAKGQNSVMQIARKIMEDQRCPWCYSEKFEIDIEPALKKQSDRKGKGNFTNRFNQKFGVGSDKAAANDDPNVLEFSDDDRNQEMQFRQNQQQMVQRTNISGTVYKRHKVSLLEQKLNQFDLAAVDQGVTTDNF